MGSTHKVSRRGLVLGALCVPVASGHRQHTAYSSVVWSDVSRRIAVTHRLEINDARVAVLKSRSASFDSVRSQARCARYVSGLFSISGKDDPLDLRIVGAETEGRYIFVYQEASGLRLRIARVSNRILMDVFPEQVNRVNIDMGSGVRTLIFTRHDGVKSVVLD